MNHQVDQTKYSGFAKFSDQSARDSFVGRVLDEDPSLKDSVYLPENDSIIIFEDLTDEQRDRIRSSLKGEGRWFEDVQFRTM